MSRNRGANLSPEERDERWAMVHGWRMDGVPYAEIARRLGLACNTVEEWYRAQRNHRMHERARELTTSRCLRCGGEFSSEGSHNRMCDECRGWSASPMAPDPGGHAGRRAGRPR